MKARNYNGIELYDGATPSIVNKFTGGLIMGWNHVPEYSERVYGQGFQDVQDDVLKENQYLSEVRIKVVDGNEVFYRAAIDVPKPNPLMVFDAHKAKQGIKKIFISDIINTDEFYGIISDNLNTPLTLENISMLRDYANVLLAARKTNPNEGISQSEYDGFQKIFIDQNINLNSY